jgi:NADH-quinone oxidoreductase subunit N
VSVGQLTENLFDSAFRTSLVAFRPELAICATILALLLVRMVAAGWKNGAFYVTLAGSPLALYYTLAPNSVENPPLEIFSGMLVYDSFSVYMRALLLLFVVLFTVFTQVTGVPSLATQGEFYVLILGAVLGMCLMVSANHMLMVFLGFEMASVPSYALAGFLKHRRSSGEAALKYAVFGAGAAGVMLYGISLLVGTLGSAHLPTMALQLADLLQSNPGGDRIMVLLLGGLMVMVGLAFKLSAVPFHFWAPDVFEGATAEVAAFLSIASKAAALALLVRLTFGLGYLETSLSAALEPARQYMVGLIGLLAVITCTFGNLAAYGQTNMKRLLAYSTIAHAGYMMMAVVAAVALLDTPVMGPAKAQGAIAALGFYIAIYLFMNLGAFAVVAFLRDALGSEQIDDYAGLVRRSPGLTICMALILFSLLGLPPLAGFAAKFTIFYALYDARLLVLLAIGVLNTVLSLFYYLRVVKVMTFVPEPDGRPATAAIPIWSAAGGYCLLITIPVVVLGVGWNFLFVWAKLAASMLTF